MTTPTTERVVRFVMDVALDAGCSTGWQLTDQINSLMALAEAAREESIVHVEGWNYHCRVHNTFFGITKVCPSSKLVYKAGTTASIDTKMAAMLERIGQVVYPTHAPVVDEGVQQTLDKTNALMDSLGLPKMDVESIQAIRAQPKRAKFEGTRDYYAKSSPATHHLAADLGLSTEDILQMKKAGRTPPDT